MKAAKYILTASVLAILLGAIVGGALARGGGGGGGHGGGGGGHSGGMRGGSSMHASSGMGSMHSSGGMHGGGSSSQAFASRSSGMGSFSRSGDGGRQSFNRGNDFSRGDSGNHGPGNRDFANHDSGGRDFGNRDFGNRDGGNRDHGDRGQGTRGQFSDRGPEHGHNANYDRLVAFMNDKGDGHNGGHGGDHGNGRHDGDFRQRFASNDRWDHNGDNFRHNADSIRKDFHDRNHNDVPFRSGWWDHRHFDHGFGPWGYSWWRGNPWYWWGWSTAPYLDSWLAFGWSQPCYWDYGPGAYVYYNYPTNQFYQDNKPYLPASNYYQQVYDLAHSAPAVSEADAAKSDWLPLGVFAMTKENRKDENWTVQLGVNKQGVLSGTYFNQENDGAHPLVGMVDKETHKAAWYFADGSNNQMVFETSVDNLTEPQSTVMVHFGPGDSGVWQLVRLERPEASENQKPEALPTPPQHELP
jgi:hypothetical protein